MPTSTARLAVIAAGGALGSGARLLIGLALPWSGGWPWATLIVNVVGCLAMGVLAGVLVEVRPLWRPFWLTGVLGGFTTFSAFAVETGTLLDSGRIAVALGYVAVTLVAGLLAMSAGAALAARRPGRRP